MVRQKPSAFVNKLGIFIDHNDLSQFSLVLIWFAFLPQKKDISGVQMLHSSYRPKQSAQGARINRTKRVD
jgi:hypothetical protein